MELTGRAKAKFEEWFRNNQPLCEHLNLTIFYTLPKSTQWGIIQDWTDCLGVTINVDKLDEGFRIQFPMYRETRQEARNAAIKKLNELINEQ